MQTTLETNCATCGKPLPKMPPSHLRKYCSQTCAGKAKVRYPQDKTCAVCRRTWVAHTRDQGKNRTCSPECSRRALSEQRKGKPSPQDQRIETPCAVCGKPTKRSPSRMKRITTPVCSYECNGVLRAKSLIGHSGNMKGRKRSDPRYGAENPAWKGGVTYFRKKGNYKPIKYVRCPLDLIAMARKDGYVMEHRLLMARMTGYPLMRVEVVHHADHDPQNNEDTNLELWPTNQAHKLWEGGRCAIGAACRFSPKDSARR